MKKFFKIFLPILLVLSILLCTYWYLFIYDREFTRDMLLYGARHFEAQGDHAAATWFYNSAYNQAEDSDAVAIELSNQYKASGNYTKAEYTLTNAISDGCGIDVYIALCKLFVEQDKLLDAVSMLDSVANPEIKSQLDALRPAAPVASHTPGFYNEYLQIKVTSDNGTVYATADDVYPSVTSDAVTGPFTLSDGENSIYALTVGENGLVSTVSAFYYTIGGVIEIVEFVDPVMEAEIRKMIGVDDDAVVYTNDLWDISAMTIPQEASDYSDLLLLPYLESLTISKGIPEELSKISNLSSLKSVTITDTAVPQDLLGAIASFPGLNHLVLNNCELSSITALENARELTHLDLGNNTIRNISPLSLIQGLKVLRLSHNAVSDLSALSVLTQLETLDISYNTISNLSPIASLSSLTELNAEHNAITDVSALAGLADLTLLNLADNAITDVSSLQTCINLEDLNISQNTIESILPLSALEHLMYFDFSENQVAELPTWSKSCLLVTIDGSNNLISSLAPLAGLESLNNVYMDYNEEIASVEELADCPVLILVNIYGTSVTEVSTLKDQSVIVNYDPTVGED